MDRMDKDKDKQVLGKELELDMHQVKQRHQVINQLLLLLQSQDNMDNIHDDYGGYSDYHDHDDRHHGPNYYDDRHHDPSYYDDLIHVPSSYDRRHDPCVVVYCWYRSYNSSLSPFL